MMDGKKTYLVCILMAIWILVGVIARQSGYPIDNDIYLPVLGLLGSGIGLTIRHALQKMEGEK